MCPGTHAKSTHPFRARSCVSLEERSPPIGNLAALHQRSSPGRLVRRAAAQPAQEPVELVQGSEAKGDAARANLGRASGEITHLLLEAPEVGILAVRAQVPRRTGAFSLRGGAITSSSVSMCSSRRTTDARAATAPRFSTTASPGSS